MARKGRAGCILPVPWPPVHERTVMASEPAHLPCPEACHVGREGLWSLRALAEAAGKPHVKSSGCLAVPAGAPGDGWPGQAHRVV